MVNEWDQYNNPSKGQYRDPQTEITNLHRSGDAGQTLILYPFGTCEIIEDNNTIKKLRFPKEYERRYSSEENWLHVTYNMLQCAANRHFWFLLTLGEKYELCEFLKKHSNDKVYKMAKSSYKFIDLYCDFSKFQFTADNDRFIGWIISKNNEMIDQFIYTKYITYGNDYLLLESIKPWENLTFDKIENRIEIMDLDKENIYIHDGQYIMNFTDPYGQQRW